MTEIRCKRCGKIVEFKPGVPLNITFLEEFELEDPKYKYCFECRKKWSEKNLKCKRCGKRIGMHEYLWHSKLCGFCEQENLIEIMPEK